MEAGILIGEALLFFFFFFFFSPLCTVAFDLHMAYGVKSNGMYVLIWTPLHYSVLLRRGCTKAGS